MRIDGRVIASHILTQLTDEVMYFRTKAVIPTIVVLLVGDNTSSLSYIKQKRKAAEIIGAKLIFEQLPASSSTETLASIIAHYNEDKDVHGIIIQRPVPIFDEALPQILSSVAPEKDIDGFLPGSPFTVPVARAVMMILESTHAQLLATQLVNDGFLSWLRAQTITVVGRGETAGKPIIEVLRKYECPVTVVHTQTANPHEITKHASIVISATGKPRMITKRAIKTGVILIGVGVGKEDNIMLHGDYDESEIASIASFYTPTPGGVGPVNVACLMQNLVEATRRQVV